MGRWFIRYKYMSDTSVPVALCKGMDDTDYEVARWHIDTFYCNTADRQPQDISVVSSHKNVEQVNSSSSNTL